MELWLVRHAQPEWSRDRTAQVDPGLTDRGEQQARRTAERLAGERFDEILVSTAARAQATAAPIVDGHAEAKVEDRAWLHEIHMPGAWQGTPGGGGRPCAARRA